MDVDRAMEPDRQFNTPRDRRRLFFGKGLGVVAGVVVVALLAPLAQAQLKLPGRDLRPGASEPADPAKLATLTLLSEHDVLVPGQTTWLALRFRIHDGWHLYWRNNGDTGAPMMISVLASGSTRVGEVQYPAPEWHPMPGGFVDFIYEREAVLLVPVTLSPDQPVGSEITIIASAEWLICKDVCLAGSGSSSLRLPVRESASPTEHAPAFARTRLRMPQSMGEAHAKGIEATWRPGRTLIIEAPGATRVTFFPYESDANAYPEDVAETGRVSGESLLLTYDEHADEAETIGGVLEVRSASGLDWYEIVVGPPRSDRPGEGAR